MTIYYSPQEKRGVYQVSDNASFFRVDLSSDEPSCSCLRLQVNDKTRG